MNEQMNIYRSFEQWKNGNVLEHGVPRIEYYSEAQLDLVEMGWNYGYDSGRAVEQALDKKADNARELGLSYDDEPKIGCVNHDCDKCKAVGEIKTEVKEAGNGSFTITDAHSTADVVRWLLTQDTKETILCLIDEESQPAPVQERNFCERCGKRLGGEGHIHTCTPPAQPAQKPWMGLTAPEIHETEGYEETREMYRFALAIEAKLKEKNT